MTENELYKYASIGIRNEMSFLEYYIEKYETIKDVEEQRLEIARLNNQYLDILDILVKL